MTTYTGTPHDRLYRIPTLLMLAAAPLLGLAFVIFLPLIGFVMVARLLGDKLLRLINQRGGAMTRKERSQHAR